MRKPNIYIIIFQPGGGGHIIASLISNTLRDTPIFITPIHANCHNFEGTHRSNFSIVTYKNYLQLYKKCHDVVACGHPQEMNVYNEEFIKSLARYNKINLIFVDTHSSRESQVQSYVNMYIKYDHKLIIKCRKNWREIIHTYVHYERYVKGLIGKGHPVFNDILDFMDKGLIIKKNVYESMLDGSNELADYDINFQVRATNRYKQNFHVLEDDVNTFSDQDAIFQKATLPYKDKINVYAVDFRSMCNNRSNVLTTIANITGKEPTEYGSTSFDYWHQITKMLYTRYLPYVDYESGKINV